MATPGRLHRMRAVVSDGGADVRVLIQHPMETGSRKDPVSGELVPRHFIQEIHCEHNGREVMSAYWSWGMAINPYLAFRLTRARPGDRVRVHWIDNLGVQDGIDGQIA